MRTKFACVLLILFLACANASIWSSLSSLFQGSNKESSSNSGSLDSATTNERVVAAPTSSSPSAISSSTSTTTSIVSSSTNQTKSSSLIANARKPPANTTPRLRSPKPTHTHTHHTIRFANSSTTPTKHSFDDYLTRKMKDNLRRFGPVSKLVFLGDSIMYKIGRNASLWNDLETKYGAINLASPGDKTENILHRLNNDKFPITDLKARPIIVILIGSNNVAVGDAPAVVVAGISAVVDKLSKSLNPPASSIAVVSILPRGIKEFNKTVGAVNDLLEKTFGRGSSSNAKKTPPPHRLIKQQVISIRGTYSYCFRQHRQSFPRYFQR